MNQEKNKPLVQQEIAPCANAALNVSVADEGKSTPAPAESKKKNAGVFYSPTLKITYIAVFIALSVVTGIFSINIIPQIVILSFFYIPVMLAGIFLGPAAGFTIGILGDLLGAMIAPKGAYLPLIGVASGLIGFFPGLIFKIKSENKILDSLYFKITLSMALVLVICTAGLNTYALWDVMARGKKTFWAFLWSRFPGQALVALINAVLITALYHAIIRTNKYLKK